MSEAKAGGAVSTYTVIGNVDSNGKAQSLATTPLSVESAGGTYAYAAGTSTTTVDVPTAAKLREVSVVAGASVAATVTIGGGNTITVPAGASFSATQFGGTANLDVVIGGTIQSYYVAWTA